MLAIKPNDLSSILGTQMVEGENQFPKVVFCHLPMCHGMCVHTINKQINTPTNTFVKKKKVCKWSHIKWKPYTVNKTTVARESPSLSGHCSLHHVILSTSRHRPETPRQERLYPQQVCVLLINDCCVRNCAKHGD